MRRWWGDAKLDERDPDGNLTPLALALDALVGAGCDCGTDEPGTCLSCLCEAGLHDLHDRLENADAMRQGADAELAKVSALVPGEGSPSVRVAALVERCADLAERLCDAKSEILIQNTDLACLRRRLDSAEER